MQSSGIDQSGKMASGFKEEEQRLMMFLENFMTTTLDDTGEAMTGAKYIAQLQRIANRELATLTIDLDDVEEFFKFPEDGQRLRMAQRVEQNTHMYLGLFANAADAKMPPPSVPADMLPEDVYDVLLEQRQRAAEVSAAQAASAEGGLVGADPRAMLPASLTRRYEVLIRPCAKAPACKLREISSSQVGQLVKFKGIVTQASDVRPLLTVATYLDDKTGLEFYQEVVSKKFMPLAEAPEDVKRMHGGKSELHMQVRGSKFVKYQECKIQECPDEVPQGSTPRTLVIHLKGELTRSVKAGDSVSVSGIFLPEPYTGPQAMLRASLLTTTYLQAMEIKHNKISYQDMNLSEDQRAAIENMTEEGDIYSRLANSIAPEIYGHEDVKKALLLAMVGGVSKQLPDGMKLRGDIHACLMGDPGVAKSQLMRYVTYISPRAVYTTGKGSSGVGLTAAVVKDPHTNELVLEGGALVMADKGICCIDEFDKMEESDRTAIHEVMEQQTVSIAKAGITTTLNTRTTVLAAANPAFGRYDTRRSPAENINLPAALLSRFDFLWLILDKRNVDSDLALARHVLCVHRDGRAPQPEGPAPLSPELLRAYIAAAKQHEPYVPESLTDYVAAVYAEMRSEEAASELPHSYTTARTLLSLLRIGQALARLRFADHVEQSDIDEALRLMKMSKSSLYEDTQGDRAIDPVSQVFSRVRAHLERTKAPQLTWAQLLDLLGTSFKPDQIRQCLLDYASIGVWQVDSMESDTPTLLVSEEQ